MKDKIAPVLQLEDVAAIFRVTSQTVARWLRDARRGKNNLPPPLDIPGRRLVWSRDSIEEYLNRNQKIANTPKTESASKLRQRHNAAMNEIERRHGIKSQTGKEANK